MVLKMSRSKKGSIKLLPLPSKIVEKLINRGLTTIESLSLLSPKELAEITNLSEEECIRILKIVEEYLYFKPLTVNNLLPKGDFFTTGCSSLDNLLNGGIQTCNVYEFVGEFGTGKTQICHQLCVTVQLSRKYGGLGKKAVYIDTEGTFVPERIIHIAKRFNLDTNKTLKNIYYARIRSLSEQIASLIYLRDLLKKENIGLIVVDSVIKHYRLFEVGKRVTIKFHELAQFLYELRELARENNLAVVITNQVVSIPNGRRLEVSGDPYIGMYVDFRILLHKVRETIRRAELIFGKGIHKTSALFRIVEEGVIDLST